MSREIKYRFRYTDGKNWIFETFSMPEILNGAPLEVLDNEPLLKQYKLDGWDEYTGLKDKNGVEIYEGDIVRCKMVFDNGSLPHVGEVVYVEEFGAFATKNEAGETLLHNHFLDSLEVIGNIYEPADISPETLTTVKSSLCADYGAGCSHPEQCEDFGECKGVEDAAS